MGLLHQNTELEDDPRSGRPITTYTPANIELVRLVIEAEPHSTYDDIEAETHVRNKTARNHPWYLKNEKADIALGTP